MKKLLVFIFLITVFSHAKSTGYKPIDIDLSPAFITSKAMTILRAGDGENIFYNPATLANTNSPSLKLSYLNYIEDGVFTSLSYANKTDFLNYGISLKYFQMDNFEGRLVPSDDPEYTFEARNFSLGTGVSYNLSEKIALGLAALYTYEKIEYEEAYAFFTNFGLFGKDILLQNNNLEIHLQNLGKGNEMLNKEEKLPLKIGASDTYFYQIHDFEIEGGIGFNYYYHEEELIYDLFLSGGYKNTFYLKGSLSPENEGLPYALGMALKFKQFEFEYAYSSFVDEMGDNHGFSLKYNF